MRYRASHCILLGFSASLLPALFPGLAVAGDRESPAREPIRLGVPQRGDDRPGELDSVLDRLPIGSDRWGSEKDAAAVGARLKALGAAFQSGELEVDALELLSESFRGGSPVPRREERIFGGSLGDGSFGDGAFDEKGNLECRRGLSGPVGRELERRAWVSKLAELRARFSTVSKVHFKVFGISGRGAADSPASVVARSLLEADGQTPAGLYFQVRSVWQTEWTSAGPAEPAGGGPSGSSDPPPLWQLAGMDLVLFETATLRERPFADVTEAALGRTEAYRRQLRFGVGHWRTRIDSASGIDIYGHQGVTVGDYDGDGRDDLYVPQPAGLPDRLFRNLGDGRFEDVTYQAGVATLDQTGGALLVDLDNDGDLDLVVCAAHEVLLLENERGDTGITRFRPRTQSGLETASSRSAATLGAAAADYDRDGDLDLYIFSYIFWAGAGSKLTPSYPFPYHDARNGAPNFFFRNDGELRFTDVTVASGLDRNNRRFTLAASWSDFDDDGDDDLYVANDFGKNNLYVNQGDGEFIDRAEALGVDDVGNGMSVTWEDFDNDGRIDLYVGNMWSSAGNRIAPQAAFAEAALRPQYLRMARGNTLFRNLGDGRFEDVSRQSGASFGRWSWAAQFLDIEGDGYEDLYVANGFISNQSSDDL